MAEVHLDHPGTWHWFAGYGPAEVLGPCPHVGCPHNALSDIAWGPDYQHYCLVQCDADCQGTCRAWTIEYPDPYSLFLPAEFLHVEVSSMTDSAPDTHSVQGQPDPPALAALTRGMV